MSFIKDCSIDLICTHPPYADIIRYSNDIKEDISHLCYEEFLSAFECVASESFRVLKKKGHMCFYDWRYKKKRIRFTSWYEFYAKIC